MQPCAICIHYANKEPQGIDVSVTHQETVQLQTIIQSEVDF